MKMLLRLSITVIYRLKHTLAVARRVECSTTTTTSSAEPVLTSLLPCCWVVPRSVRRTIRWPKVVTIMTASELTLLMTGFKISANVLVTLVGFCRHSFRLNVVEVSFLLIAFPDVLELVIRVTISKKTSPIFIVVLILKFFSTFELMFKCMLSTSLVLYWLLIISRTSVLLTI